MPCSRPHRCSSKRRYGVKKVRWADCTCTRLNRGVAASRQTPSAQREHKHHHPILCHRRSVANRQMPLELHKVKSCHHGRSHDRVTIGYDKCHSRFCSAFWIFIRSANCPVEPRFQAYSHFFHGISLHTKTCRIGFPPSDQAPKRMSD